MKLQDFDFRLWDKFNGYRNNSDYIAVREHCGGYMEAIANYKGFDKICDDCDIELYTGFKDKYGRKIYENDIVEDDNGGQAQVVIDYKGVFALKSMETDFIVDDLYKFCLNIEYRPIEILRVVGNIHEGLDRLRIH